MKKINWSRVHESHMNGMSIKDIAEKLGLDEVSVRRIFTTKKLSFSKSEDQKYIDAYNGPYQTKPIKEVAKMMGMSNATLGNAFARLGLPRIKKGAKKGNI
jgi:transposase